MRLNKLNFLIYTLYIIFIMYMFSFYIVYTVLQYIKLFSLTWKKLVYEKFNCRKCLAKEFLKKILEIYMPSFILFIYFVI